ncbi:hypothetical protein [Thiohalophilus thiocyanatoxydans]|nr:hypothetical protein [Thiohalophilus thiocyanatoxydans]
MNHAQRIPARNRLVPVASLIGRTGFFRAIARMGHIAELLQ